MKQLKKICEIVDGPVSGEVVGLTTDEIVNEARDLAKIAPNIVVKIHAEGKMASRVEDIAKEIDALLLVQDTLQSHDTLKPRIEADSNGIPTIIKH